MSFTSFTERRDWIIIRVWIICSIVIIVFCSGWIEVWINNVTFFIKATRICFIIRRNILCWCFLFSIPWLIINKFLCYFSLIINKWICKWKDWKLISQTALISGTTNVSKKKSKNSFVEFRIHTLIVFN